jgi:hypothetical protein
MKGLQHYFGSGVTGLRYPLMALIDYRGFRMTAQALLPLGKNSLKYGSADAGKTVYKECPELNEYVMQAAEFLNLRRHVAGAATSNVLSDPKDIEANTLYSAVDIGITLLLLFSLD